MTTVDKSSQEQSPTTAAVADGDLPAGGMEELRLAIDSVDSDILDLLARRRDLAQEIAVVKQVADRPFHDHEREKAVLEERVLAAERLQLDPELVTRVWEQLLKDSRRVQYESAQGRLGDGDRGRLVAIQGIEGSFSHIAARRLLRHDDLQLVESTRFADAIEAVNDGRADVAVLPIENTTSGAIAEVYDLLLQSRLSVVGELKLRVEHCLLGMNGASLVGMRRVFGHPQAVTQCSDFLTSLEGVEIVYWTDTALSARRVMEAGDPSVGAIASAEAARLFGLSVLQSGIGNRESNYTRFVAVARDPIPVDARVPAKTSLVMSVSNRPGALTEVLGEFRDEGISLVKLESRPTIGNPWEEMFYVDFEGNMSESRVQRALQGARRRALFMKVLGTYPSEDLRTARPSLPVEDEEVEQAEARPADKGSLERSHVGYRLASRREKSDDTLIEVGPVTIGGAGLVVIGGPCAVETLEQVMACARVVKESGGTMLRGGVFKPRTSPYSFQGLGYAGLEMLVEAGRVYGLPIVTEVPSPEHVAKMAEVADVLQIGARNMQNFALLAEVGMVNRPVLLKRGMSASIDELLQAAEYILAGGNQRVILCERGIRTFETSSRNTLDLTAVPVLQARTHLPVIVDPSHAAGDRKLVAPLARAAVAIGAHGLMIEIHPDPEKALSDGPQALTLEDFAALMSEISG